MWPTAMSSDADFHAQALASAKMVVSMMEGHHTVVRAFVEWAAGRWEHFTRDAAGGAAPGVNRKAFHNAYEMARGGRGMKYYIGYAVGWVGLPQQHAWNVRGGELVEPTPCWAEMDRVTYYGVEVPLEVLDVLYEHYRTKGAPEHGVTNDAFADVQWARAERAAYRRAVMLCAQRLDALPPELWQKVLTM